MADKQEEILRDYNKCCKVINSCTKRSHISAYLKLIMNFMDKHGHWYLPLSMQLQNKLDIVQYGLQKG